MYENEKINLVDDLDNILLEKGPPASNTGSGSEGIGRIAGLGGLNDPSTMGVNFQSANIGNYVSGMNKADFQSFYNSLREYLKELLRLQKAQKNPDQQNIQAGHIKENLGYDNPYAIHQNQQPQRPEEEETMVLWDAIAGRVRKFDVNYGDMKPQGQTEPMKSSREQNRDMQIGYSLAAQQQRISQPSGGKDPRGFEIPYGARTPVGASKEELDFNLAYDELMKRSQEMQKDPTQEDGPWQGHPAVDAFLDQVERLEKIKQADGQNAEGGQPQAKPGGQGGGNPMDMMKQMMGGAGGAPEGMPPMPSKKKEDEEEEGGDLASMIQKVMGGAPEGGMPPIPSKKKEDDLFKPDSDNELETFAQAVDKAPTAGPPKELQDLLQKLTGGGAKKGGLSQKAPSAGSPPLDKDMIQKMMGGDLGTSKRTPKSEMPLEFMQMIQKMMGGKGKPEGVPSIPQSRKKKKKKGPNPRLLQALMSRLGGGR
tara:strand:+ start:772 stop:2214 length:1443 start_codon:yes stop_codon:yes gene_type:complete